MADKTGIEWTDATWNPVVGCSVVSPGCTNCYAMSMAARIERMGSGKPSHYDGTTQASKAGPVWTGKVALAPEHILTQPLHWKKPRKIFVNSMGDLFHEDVPDEWIDRVFAVMALAPQHTFQVLTKRSARMRRYCTEGFGRLADKIIQFRRERGDTDMVLIPLPHVRPGHHWWPLPNVWFGVSAEDQRRLDERVPDLLDTPAAVRWVSAEPLLGPLDLRARPRSDMCIRCGEGHGGRHDHPDGYRTRGLDWIVLGGESGLSARPMNPAWARSARDQCEIAGVAFFFKQWGEWGPHSAAPSPTPDDWGMRYDIQHFESLAGNGENDVYRLGKARAGRLLDGIEHNAMPEAWK